VWCPYTGAGVAGALNNYNRNTPFEDTGGIPVSCGYLSPEWFVTQTSGDPHISTASLSFELWKYRVFYE